MNWIKKLRNPFRLRLKHIRFTGNYLDWNQALNHSTGYDAAVILERTRAALLKVSRGEAAYERDSVLFDKVEHAYPVLAGMLRASLRENGRLSVLDFGGALGSSYFQCRGFLDPVSDLVWSVVEQSAHVECGLREFASEQLRFHLRVEESLQQSRPNVLLLSSVLQYLPSPYAILADLLKHRISTVIIDRTALLTRDQDRLTVQTVPDSIYRASYPAWFLSESKLKEVFVSCGYRNVAEFPALDRLSPDDEPAYSKGFIFERLD